MMAIPVQILKHSIKKQLLTKLIKPKEWPRTKKLICYSRRSKRSSKEERAKTSC
jgi:hypothetical protein